jgi:hypothetical protein
LPVFLEQFGGESFVALDQRAVARHVGEHDGGQRALLGGGSPRKQAYISFGEMIYQARLSRGKPLAADYD